MSGQIGNRRWRAFRKRILERDLHRCRYAFEGCTRVAKEVDHLIDRALGGGVFDERNCFSVCGSCHTEKNRRRVNGEQIGVFYGRGRSEMRPPSDLHTPESDGNEAGPLLRGDYRRTPATTGGDAW